jgi:hypothetical protein
MTSVELVHALAGLLEPILPAGVTMRADERNVIVRTRHGEDWLNVADNIELNVADGASIDEAIQTAVYCKLQELQDIVTEHLTVPWPQQAGMGRSEFLAIESEVLDGVLQIWIGGRNASPLLIGRIALR